MMTAPKNPGRAVGVLTAINTCFLEVSMKKVMTVVAGLLLFANFAMAEKADLADASTQMLLTKVSELQYDQAKAIVDANEQQKIKSTDDLLKVQGVTPELAAKIADQFDVKLGKQPLPKLDVATKGKMPRKMVDPSTEKKTN